MLCGHVVLPILSKNLSPVQKNLQWSNWTQCRQIPVLLRGVRQGIENDQFFRGTQDCNLVELHTCQGHGKCMALTYMLNLGLRNKAVFKDNIIRR